MPHKLEILYEDNHLLIVNKRAGLLVQGDKTGDKPLVESCKGYLKKKYQKPGDVFLGVVHRLDRPVSGVVVFARTSKALERMNKLFHDKKVEKVYWAAVKNMPKAEEGHLTHWLMKDAKTNKTKAYNRQGKNALKSSLSYRMLGKLSSHFLLEVNPETGRSHQIRVQLAAMGCPIRGDLKYGYEKANEDGNINLHALMLNFEHPVKKAPLSIFAPLPEDQFWNHFSSLLDMKRKTIAANQPN